MPAAATYRARLPELRALDLEDGRHVILGELPRYMASPLFLEFYDLVPERRQATRRRSARGRGKKKAERRKGGRWGGGEAPAWHAKARELLAKGKPVAEVAKKVGQHVSGVYRLKKTIEAAPKTPSSRPAAASSAGKTGRNQEPAGDGGWME
jgi:hypothetical protein